MKKTRIIIAGGGIGGLTAALCLAADDRDIQVFEAATEIRPLGVGINLLPHAVRVLSNLGLESSLANIAVATSELAYYSKQGKKIWGEARGKFAGYKWPQFSIHRGAFQLLLLEEFKKQIGGDHLHTGHVLLGAEQEGDSVSMRFADRSNQEKEVRVRGDMLIGADGIHSCARRQFYPGEGLPKFSGIILHRGTSLAPPFLSGSSMIMAGSAAKKFVAYPLTPEKDENGCQLINWVADLAASAGERIMPQDWNRPADKQRLLKEFSNWQFDWLNVPAIIDSAASIYEFPMSDRDPLPRWSFGRITLLGDAAHPMYPIGSNGASQAILDAECLADALRTADDVESALKTYESVRLPATARIVLQNRQMGPEQVMQIVEERAPNGFDKLEDVISQAELEAIASRYKTIAGFDRETLNQKN